MTTATDLDALDRSLARAYRPNRHLDALLVLRDADPVRWAALDHALRIAAETHERMRAAHRALPAPTPSRNISPRADDRALQGFVKE